jgi:hypothetical protein
MPQAQDFVALGLRNFNPPPINESFQSITILFMVFNQGLNQFHTTYLISLHNQLIR